MSFKRLLIVPLLSLAASCGLKVGEDAPANPPIVEGGNLECFSEISGKVSAYFEARASESEVREFCQCLRGAVNRFREKVKGLEKDSYYPQEIRNFLQEHFLNGKKISDKLLHDFMVLKQSLVGGGLDRVTNADLIRAIDFISFVEEQLTAIRPYMGEINYRVGESQILSTGRMRRIDEAVQVLRRVARATGERLKTAKNPYPLDHLNSFLPEFRDFVGWSSENSHEPKDWVNLLSSFKSVAVGRNGGVVQPHDWPDLLSAAGGWYGVVLKARYTARLDSVLEGYGLESLNATFMSGARLLNEAVSNQRDKVITFKQLDHLVDALEPIGFLPRFASPKGGYEMIRAKAIKQTLRPLIIKILGDNSIPYAQRTAVGLTSENIERAKAEYQRWADVQRILSQKFDPDAVTVWFDSSQPIETFTGATPEQDLQYMVDNFRPMFRKGELKAFLLEKQRLSEYGVAHGFHNLSIMNLVRAATSALFRGYGALPKATLHENGVSSEGMQAFYNDFKELGVNLRFFHPDSSKSGHRSFREANLFTYSGNGLLPDNPGLPLQSLVTYPELMEFLSMMFSSGTLSREIYRSYMDPKTGVCAAESANGSRGAHGYANIARECFARNLTGVLSPLLTTMPGMRSQLEQSSPEERQAMIESILATVRNTGEEHVNWVEWNEITMASVILHYTEAVMTRYNLDNDAVLNKDEVWMAYETFRHFMEGLVEARCDKFHFQVSSLVVAPAQADAGEEIMHPSGWGCKTFSKVAASRVFAYLVVKGKVPENIGDVNLLPNWPLVGYDFRVDRLALTKVFAALVRASNEMNKN